MKIEKDATEYKIMKWKSEFQLLAKKNSCLTDFNVSKPYKKNLHPLMGPNTSVRLEYSFVFRCDTHIWSFKNPPICIMLFVQTPQITLKEGKKNPKQLLRWASDSILTHRKYQFYVYTGQKSTSMQHAQLQHS